ncbi:MAG: carbamoyltransferase [Candidatus Peribacteraceae bacterium]|nr:carbamoyltransferase [Candidatus Peribacteraceae bacterium]
MDSDRAGRPVYILGLSCFYHDSAAVLLKDGVVVFAAQEERFTRRKHDEALPFHAVERALAAEGIAIQDIDAVVFYEKPLLKFFDRILSTIIAVWPRGFLMFHRAMHEWLKKKLWIPQIIQKELRYRKPILYISHHESHAASAYFLSGFPDATIVTVDGVGEWATTAIGYGKGTELSLKEELHFPHSLGLLYSAITYYLGFRVNSAEYKVMGLAPYGQPVYLEQMRSLMDLKEDGSFRLCMRYFTYEYGSTMTGGALERLFGQPRRTPEAPLTQFHKDIACSLQELTNEVMLRIVRHAKRICPSDYLCLAGGVALNCVANGVLQRSNLFRDIFIQPAAGDAGGALGAALTVWHRRFNGRRMPRLEHVFLGTVYGREEIEAELKKRGLPYTILSDDDFPETVGRLLTGENVIGWFQGRMEFGPRALGNRSIIADARNPHNWQKVNLKIKFRESFRPFAPTVLAERARDYFTLEGESPFMLLVADVLPHRRTEIPAVTHVDGSARIQTIRRDQNPRYYDLLKAFERRTGCPVIINTSFNVRGEPIVESPADAINCFLHTQMDYLVLGNYLLEKSAMTGISLGAQQRYLGQFALD